MLNTVEVMLYIMTLERIWHSPVLVLPPTATTASRLYGLIQFILMVQNMYPTRILPRNDLAIYYGWGDGGFSRGVQFNGDWMTTSAAFWKIRDISLDFAIPQKWYGKFKALKSVGLSFFGRNLFTWRPKENIYTDPEFAGAEPIIPNALGITNTGQTPPVRQYGGTLRVNF